jgi:hypothetical protein
MTTSWKASLVWVSWLFAFGALNCFTIPACRRCARKLHAIHWLELLGIVLLGFGYLQWIAPLISPHLPLGWRRSTIGLIAFVLVGGVYWIWWIHFPPPFDITVTKDCVQFDFNELPAAVRFVVANRHAASVKLGPYSSGNGQLNKMIEFYCNLCGVEIPTDESASERAANGSET